MNESSINTRCPACHTAFNVTNGQLKVADGLVRCGSCLHVFNAQPPTSTPIPTPTKNKKHTAAGSSNARQQPRSSQPQTKQPAQQPSQQPASQRTQPSIQLPSPTNDLELFEETLTEGALSRYITNFLILSLTALCIIQIFWFQKDKWVQQDQFRPVYQAVYTILDKPLPAKRSPDLIINKQFIIQPHEELADAIRISILLENSADFSQPFPTLQFIFSDLKGRTTAQRTLPANEYIITQLFPQQLMPSKQPIQIQLDMMAPGRRATGYQLNLI